MPEPPLRSNHQDCDNPRDFALRLMGGRGRVIERKLIATVRRQSAVIAAAVAAVPENSTVVPVGWRSMSVATDRRVPLRSLHMHEAGTTNRPIPQSAQRLSGG
jgi:hypothetical protein